MWAFSENAAEHGAIIFALQLILMEDEVSISVTHTSQQFQHSIEFLMKIWMDHERFSLPQAIRSAGRLSEYGNIFLLLLITQKKSCSRIHDLSYELCRIKQSCELGRQIACFAMASVVK